ncbi:hypothetical protein EDD17DRAFT_1878111 [Pisolithus thermaeus]|nr:hypothetical protein EV401DRAFT_2111127 [Pisolithus croceorrhizus]KAI6152962.1 hypothetical protein EDD17DRAFT_1878111 [Pisolithus thermaeus]
MDGLLSSIEFHHTDRPPSLPETLKGMAANLAEDIQGPFLIGLTMNIFLYGVTAVQAYLYFIKYKRDRLWLRSLIVILYLAETFNCIISIYYIYDVLVTHFGDEANLLTGSWVFTVDAALTGTIGVVVQHFFAWRVYVLTKNMFMVAAIVLCSLASLAGSLSATVSMATDSSLSLLPSREFEVTTWLAGAVLADMIIAISLVWYLGGHKHLYPALTSTINRILRITVQTGVLTTIVAIIDLTCYLAISSGFHLIFSMTLSKLYTNCMLSTLNARGTWKYDRSSEDEVSHGRSRSVVFQAQSTQLDALAQAESHQMTGADDGPLCSISGLGNTFKRGCNDEEASTNASDV